MPDLSAELGAFGEDDAQSRRRERELVAALKRITDERDELRQRLDFQGRLEGSSLNPPKWLQTKASRSTHHATPCLMLSDLHFDEVVDPAQVDWFNAYNREIAEKRLVRTVENTILLAKEYFAGLKYDGLTTFLGGDILSGIIHQELSETNEAPILASMLHWEERLASALLALVDYFGKMHVVCTYGNHGRRTLKPVAKMRAYDSFEWAMYRHLATYFRNDKRITWQIPDAADCHLTIYDTRFLLTHGDQFRGGSGIAGALSPLMLGTHRKTRRQIALSRPYDVMVVGHWHQYMSLPGKGLIVNGSMKGYDEYAYISNFEPEPPQQAFWLVTPEHGISFQAPILCADRAAEGW